MPKYIVEGRTYNIPDDKVEGFERKYPNSSVEYHNGEQTYHIPISKREGFLKKFPNAVTQASLSQPSLEVKQDNVAMEQPVSVDPTIAVPTPKVEDEVKQDNVHNVKDNNKFGTQFKSGMPQVGSDAPTKKLAELNKGAMSIPKINTELPTMEGVFEREQNLKDANRGQVSELAANIEQQLNRRGEELDAEAAKNPIMMQAHGTAQSIPSFDANRTIDPEYRNYNAAKKSLEAAQNMIDAADANAEGEGFFGSVGRGFGEKFFDLNTYDMGMGDLSDNTALLKALDAYDKGELTPSQQALLDAKAVELATAAYFGSEVGRGYKAGKGIAESIPFMIEMAINPAKAVGQGLTQRVARFAIDRFGKKSAKAAALKAAGRAVGDLMGASAMTATTGAIRTAADAARRMQGDIDIDIDKNGEAFFAGHTEGDSLLKAAAKAFANTTIENYSEMVGEYFAPIIGEGTAFGRKALDKVHLGKVNEFIDNVAASDVARAINQFENYAKWNGTIGEFAEEMVGGALNAAIVGDQKFDNSEKGIFNGENMADTALSVGLLGGFFSSIKTAGYPFYKIKANRAIDSARVDFKDAFGDKPEFNALDEALSSNNLEQAKIALAGVLADESLKAEDKEKAVKYAQAIQRYNGAVRADQKRREELQTPEQNEVEASFEQGYDLNEPQQMNDAQLELDAASDELRRVFGLAEDEDIDAFLGDDPLEGIMLSREMGANAEEQHIKLNYLNAKAKVEGMYQKVRDDIGSAVEQSNKLIESRVNKETHMIQPATLKTEDRQVYVVSGNVKMFDDGSAVDPANSSKYIIVRDAATGKLEMLSPNDVLRVDASLDPEEEATAAANIIREEYATAAANKIDGVVPFAVGDEYAVVFDDGTQHTAKVVADNGDGNVQIQIDNEPQATVASKEQVQQMVNAANKARIAQSKQSQVAEQPVAEETQEVAPEQPQEVEQPQVAEQTEQAPRVVPMLKDGVTPDFNAMDSEMFVDEYVSRYGEDNAVKIARRNIAAAKDNIAKIDKKIDDVLDPNQMGSLYAQRKAYEDNLNRYNDILGRLGASEDANETESDQQSRLKKEAGNRIASLFPNGMPNVESFILADIATGNRLRWSDKIANGAVTSKGLGAELGLSEAERRKRLPLIGKEAMTPEEYAESLKERLESVGIRYDESSLRDAVLDVYSSVDSRNGAWKALESIANKANEQETDTDWESMQQERAYKQAQSAEENVPELPNLETIEEETPISKGEYAEMEAKAQAEEQKDYDAMMAENPPVEESVEQQIEVAEQDTNIEPTEDQNAPAQQQQVEQKKQQNTTNEQEADISDEDIAALWEKSRDELWKPDDELGHMLHDKLYEAHPEAHQPEERKRMVRHLIEAVEKHKDHPIAKEVLKYVKYPDSTSMRATPAISYKENKRREPLRERANQWVDSVGVKVNVIESYDEIPTIDAKEAIAQGHIITGWVSNGEVFLYMPHIANKTEVDKTYLHEVVAHIGLEQLLGEEVYNEFCQRVWDEVMTDEQKEEYINYPNVDSEVKAAHEYIAHLAEDSDLDQTTWQKIVRIFKDVLRALGVDIHLTNEDIRNMIVESYNNLRKAAEGIEAEGGAVDTKRGDASFAVKDILKGEQREKAIDDLIRVTGRSRETVIKYIKAEESLARIILDEDNVAFLDLQVDESVPSIWENSDYPQGTVEFSNICRKRLPFTMIYQQLQEEFPNTVFDATTLETIRGILKDNGVDVACGLCFVEDRRQLLGEIGQGFIDAVKGKNTDVNEKQKEALSALKESGDSYVPSLYELLTLDGMKKLRREHPEVAVAFIKYNNARGMQAGRLFQAYSAYHRDILGFSAARVKKINNSGGLRIFSYSDFEAHHLIDLVQVLTDCSRKGIKVQGYTKVPEFAKAVKDTKMKLNRSLIAKGTGIVDADYIPQEGEAVSPNVIDGKRLLLDTVEGINVNHPDFFDSSSSANVGNILVGINDEHIKLAMADPFVDYIIPFHSGIKEETLKQKGIGDWKNYKLEQLEKIDNGKGKLVNADKHGVNIYTGVLSDDIKTEKQFVEKYLEVCKTKGWIPKFHRLLNTNKNGDFVYTKGYYKLLLDYKLFNKNGKILPQEVVSPIFDSEYNKQILDNYVEEEKAKAPNTEIYEKVKETLKEQGVVSFRFIGEKGAANIDKAEEATIRLDNLAIAREMEEANKSPRTIKEATGWERGADGKWRYEVDDEITAKTIRGLKGAGLKKILEARSKRINDLDKFAYITTIVGVDQLYDADKIMATSWPEAQKKTWLDAYNIYKDDRDAAIRDVTQARKILRQLTNFGKGEFFLYEALGNEHPLFKEYPQMRNVKLVIKPYKGGKNMGGYNRLTNTIEIVDFRGIMENDKGEGTANTLTHEIQHVIQGIEGFARGGNVNMVNPNAVKERNEQAAVISDKIEALRAKENKLWEEQDSLNKTFEDWYDSHPEDEHKEIMQDEQMSEANKRYSEVSEQITSLQDERIELEQQLNDLMRNTDTSLGIEGYKRLAGEVEARNVERRRNMSLGERRNSPAWLTEDVARKDQIFIEDALGEDSVQFRISDYDSEFNDLQSEYDALDKNDEQALNEWRNKKVGVVEGYLYAVANRFGMKPEIVVFNGAEETQLQAAYEQLVAAFERNGATPPSYEAFKAKSLNKKVFATYRKGGDIITLNISTKDEHNYKERYSENLHHENAHHLANILYNDKELADIWEDAAKEQNAIVEKINTSKLYKDKSDSSKGNEYLAQSIGALVREQKSLFLSFVRGKEGITADDVAKKLKIKQRKANFAITEILNRIKDEYQESRKRDENDLVERVGNDRPLRVGGRSVQGDVQRRAERGDERGVQRGFDVVNAATSLAESLGVKLNVVEDVNDITDANSTMQRAKRGAKAWYDVATDQVYFVAPNATSVQDAEESVLHEVVAHKGLRDVVGRERFNAFLEKVYRGADADTRKKITEMAAKNGWNFRVATEEYLASLAERGFEDKENRTFFEKVRDLFMDMLREAKIAIGYNITDNDMRYMLWRTYQMQKSKGVMAAAEDVLMQQKLGVGNFRTRPMGEEKVSFRSAGDQAAQPTKGIARQEYDKAVRRHIEGKNTVGKYENVGYKIKEAYQDSMLSVKKLQEAIIKEAGGKLLDSMDAYTAENQLSSKNKAEMEAYERDYANAMMEQIGALLNDGASYEEIVDYMLAKHGLERNIVFSIREAEKRGGIWNGVVTKDYAGLTELTGDEKNFTDEAQKIVDEFEQKHDTEAMWKAINAATKASLKKSYDSGMMDKETFNNVSTMFNYYIPLRGWDNNSASNHYEYIGGSNVKISPALKTAKGRKSRADDPIATILLMGQSSIVQGNRNKMKQRLLNLALAKPTSLLTVNDVWYVKQADGTWRPEYPVIPENATGDEVDAITKQFEEKMEALGANARKSKQGLDLDYRTTYWEGQEHTIRVMRNGKEYLIFVNGNPNAAQAINGFTNPNAAQGKFAGVEEFVSKWTRVYGGLLTSQNPAFMFSNLSRDLIFAGYAVAIKEDAKYAAKYTKNIASILGAGKTFRLLSKWEKGTLDTNKEVERYFKEFLENGGETGFTNMQTLDDYKRDVERFLKKAGGSKVAKAIVPFEKISDFMEHLNRGVEDMTRFAVYMTSRQSGRSITQSVANAKDITVNFNKKGRGNMGAGVMNLLYLFFNATMQSLNNFGGLFKNHPLKATAAASTMVAAGVIVPMLIEALGGDDDEEYYNLPDWVRRNNLCFRIPSTDVFITIPLPHELRPFYGVGEIFASMLQGEMSAADGLKQAAQGFASLSPIDFLGNDGDLRVNLTPSLFQPLAQLAVNKDYFGTPIQKETPYNELNPAWMKAYKGTNAKLVEATKALNTFASGEELKSGGWLDWSPAKIEYFFESYLGGVGKTLIRAGKTFSMIWNEDAQTWRNVPILSSFVYKADERNKDRVINDKYDEVLDEAKDTAHTVSQFKKAAKDPNQMTAMEYAEKLDEFMKSPTYKRYSVINDAKKKITKAFKALDNVDKADRKAVEDFILETKLKMFEELENIEEQGNQ